MGIGMWVVAGLGAFALGRLLRAGRSARWTIEAFISVISAVSAGLTATALDFGGWREPDWRAGVFSLLVAFAVIGLGRLAHVIWSTRRDQPASEMREIR